ncbi:MAG: glycerol-3-phosphate 1-O-acyltransferase PlsY [Oscillospiraceae bacterium]|nr:glycerol-3-phosphate 1-O-acyltransferase PlsY [Oscillospiraceae bacterium]
MENFLFVLSLVLAGVLAYLIGSMNFAIIVTRLLAHKDIRDFGSGNAGMTNVLRTLGKGPAVLVTVGDFCKGLVSVLLGHLLVQWIGGTEPPYYLDYIIALLVMLGHCFPVFYGFKGGKGILVSAGVILALNPPVLLGLLVIFLIVVACTRIVSVASITVAAAYPVLTLLWGLWQGTPHLLGATLSALVIGGIVIWMHRSNIRRLLDGTENKFGKKK